MDELSVFTWYGIPSSPVTEKLPAAMTMTSIAVAPIDGMMRGNVTLLSSTPMNAEQFYQAYLAILQVYGFMAVPSGNIIKVMPDTNMRQIPANDLQAQRHLAFSLARVTPGLVLMILVGAAVVFFLLPRMPSTIAPLACGVEEPERRTTWRLIPAPARRES